LSWRVLCSDPDVRYLSHSCKTPCTCRADQIRAAWRMQHRLYLENILYCPSVRYTSNIHLVEVELVGPLGCVDRARVSEEREDGWFTLYVGNRSTQKQKCQLLEKISVTATLSTLSPFVGPESGEVTFDRGKKCIRKTHTHIWLKCKLNHAAAEYPNP